MQYLPWFRQPRPILQLNWPGPIRHYRSILIVPWPFASEGLSGLFANDASRRM